MASAPIQGQATGNAALISQSLGNRFVFFKTNAMREVTKTSRVAMKDK